MDADWDPRAGFLAFRLDYLECYEHLWRDKGTSPYLYCCPTLAWGHQL